MRVQLPEPTQPGNPAWLYSRMFTFAPGKSTGVITHFWYSTVHPNCIKALKNDDGHLGQSQWTLQCHQRPTHDRDNIVNQGQATQPGTPSYCSTYGHTIYQAARSNELAAPTQDSYCMGGGSGDEMRSEASHLH